METKNQILKRLSKEGHSFPHWNTCNTCEDDFEEVCRWERMRLLDDIFYFIQDNIFECQNTVVISNYIKKLKITAKTERSKE